MTGPARKPRLLERESEIVRVLAESGTVDQACWERWRSLVGVLESAPFEDRDARLSPGELLLLCTDGAIELRRHDLSFGERRLERALREHAGSPAQEVVDTIAAGIEDLQDGTPRDDVALLALGMPSARHA